MFMMYETKLDLTIYSLLVIFATTCSQEFVQILISKLWPFLNLDER